MAMRLAEDHGVSLVGTASAAVTGASLLAVQWFGEGGAIAAGVALIGALVTFAVAIISQSRASFRAQQRAQADELRSAREWILRLEGRIEERDRRIDELETEVGRLRSLVPGG